MDLNGDFSDVTHTHKKHRCVTAAIVKLTGTLVGNLLLIAITSSRRTSANTKQKKIISAGKQNKNESFYTNSVAGSLSTIIKIYVSPASVP